MNMSSFAEAPEGNPTKVRARAPIAATARAAPPAAPARTPEGSSRADAGPARRFRHPFAPRPHFFGESPLNPSPPQYPNPHPPVSA